MNEKYIEIDLSNDEKKTILKYASFLLGGDTKNDLENKRKKWIRFYKPALPEVIGEISYHCNRSINNDEMFFLNELASHLENCLFRSKRKK